MGGGGGKILKFLTLVFSSFCFLNAKSNTIPLEIISSRQTLEIGIDTGTGGSPPPLESAPCGCQPKPSDFINNLQYQAYLVIQRFKKTITCDPHGYTNNWNGPRPCDYKGFFCATPPDRTNTPTIASVDFNAFNLCAPTISGFVDQLPDLALFHVNSNNFTGIIPDLTKLKFLYELDISNNAFTGPFPANVIPLDNLLFLDLRFNNFFGTVPPNIFLLGLDVLFLNNNNFNQPLPADLGKSPVAYLTLANNFFTGPIPRSIANQSDTLIEVLFLNNSLSGCLPYEVGLLKEATVFDAGFNFITGPIPISFGCLLKVDQLNLAGNHLYGEVPDLVCRLAKVGQLTNLSLSGNYFTSVGPSCYKLIHNKVLDVRGNCIPWFPDQRSPAECWRFLAWPKYCPYHSFIPCKLPRHRKHGGAPPPPPPSLPAAEPPPPELVTSQVSSPAPSPTYTSYYALHKHRGL